MFAAIPALFVSGMALGILLGAIEAKSVNDWIGAILYATTRTFFFGVVPAVSLGAHWYASYYRNRRMPFLVYLSAGPAVGIVVSIFDLGSGLVLGVVISVFLVALHLLVKVFPGLIE